MTNPITLARWPSTPRKPSTRWFRLFSQYRSASDEVPPHVLRFWDHAQGRPGSGLGGMVETGGDRPAGIRLSAGNGDVHLEQRGDVLSAFGTSVELLEFVDGPQARHLPRDEVEDQIFRLLYPQLRRVVGAVATRHRLTTPPPMPQA